MVVGGDVLMSLLTVDAFGNWSATSVELVLISTLEGFDLLTGFCIIAEFEILSVELGALTA